MTHTGIVFHEENIKLDRPTSRAILREKSPSGFVPFLTHGDTKIWDSLAICEYLSDLYPEKNLWPSDIKARAIARALAAEMHSGFSALRGVWPMMVLREGMKHTTSGGVERDIRRIEKLWTDCRSAFGADGPFLFGAFSIADAMYAPVVSRFITYGPVALNETAQTYLETINALPAMQKWIDDAHTEVSL